MAAQTNRKSPEEPGETWHFRYRGQLEGATFTPARLLFITSRLAAVGLSYSLLSSPSAQFSIFKFIPWAYPSRPPPTTPLSLPLGVGELLNDAAARLQFASPGSFAVWGTFVVQSSIFITHFLAWRRERFPLSGDGNALSISAISFAMDAVLNLLHLYTASRNPTWSSGLAGWMLPPTVLCALVEIWTMQQKRAFKKDPKNNGKILDAGLWGVVRNPNYIFSHMWRFTQGVALFGWPGLLFGWGMLKDAIDNQIPGVEWYMQKKYGEKYDAYKKRVPYRLIPGIY